MFLCNNLQKLQAIPENYEKIVSKYILLHYFSRVISQALESKKNKQPLTYSGQFVRTNFMVLLHMHVQFFMCHRKNTVSKQL